MTTDHSAHRLQTVVFILWVGVFDVLARHNGLPWLRFFFKFRLIS